MYLWGENMAHKKLMMRTILSSPSDMKNERKIITRVIEEINEESKNTPFGIELYKWETDTYPSIILDDGQKSIDKTFDYKHADLFIGMFYKIAGEGTKHEISEAINIKKAYGFPEIKLYFKEFDTMLPDATEDEIKNFQIITDIKKKYMALGLCRFFDNHTNIESEFRKHIQRTFNEFKKTFAFAEQKCLFIPEVENTKINPYKLYYHRAKIKKMSINALSKKTGLSASKIRKYEKISFSNNDNKIYPKCSYNEIKSLEEALEIKSETLCITEFEKEIINHYDYYKSKKNINKKNNQSKYKAIVFDFDGTLVDPFPSKTTWQRIWQKLGYKLNICEELQKKYITKQISHQEWCDLTAEYFIKKNMNKDILYSIANEIKPINGFRETIKKLYNNNIPLFIVSGSILEIIYKVLGSDTKYFKDISANEFIFNKKGKLNSIKGTDFDFEGKSDYIKNLCKHTEIQPKDILFIGNSNNDSFVHKSGARTLCVNPTHTDSLNQKTWNYSIENMSNLNEILDYCKIT